MRRRRPTERREKNEKSNNEIIKKNNAYMIYTRLIYNNTVSSLQLAALVSGENKTNRPKKKNVLETVTVATSAPMYIIYIYIYI